MMPAGWLGVRRIPSSNELMRGVVIQCSVWTFSVVVQRDLFDLKDRDKFKALMSTLDSVNSEMGNGFLKFGAEGTGKRWRMKQDSLSPRYTTKWSELINVF